MQSNEYVIYDRANDRMLRFEESGEVIIFGNKQEAIDDLYGNEEVVAIADLSNDNKKIILKQIQYGRQ